MDSPANTRTRRLGHLSGSRTATVDGVRIAYDAFICEIASLISFLLALSDGMHRQAPSRRVRWKSYHETSKA
jgi:hypothetical protein